MCELFDLFSFTLFLCSCLGFLLYQVTCLVATMPFIPIRQLGLLIGSCLCIQGRCPWNFGIRPGVMMMDAVESGSTLWPLPRHVTPHLFLPRPQTMTHRRDDATLERRRVGRHLLVPF